MKKIELDVPIEILTKDYLELNSSYKVAKKYNTSATAVKRLLKEAGVLRTQNEAARIRNLTHDVYRNRKFSKEHREKLSEVAKNRIGEKNPFFGKTHTKEAKAKIGRASKKRTGKRNPNYKHGKNIRRPRDFKNSEMQSLRNHVFHRDKHTCVYCGKKGGHLHAHHILPYWVKPVAFLDKDNLVTVCTKCHFKKAHLGNWHKFDVELVTEKLLIRYSLDRERLSELATYKYKVEAIV